MARTKSPQFIPDPIFSFDDTAIVMFNTNMMNHEFAAKLNDALQLKLTRIDDIPRRFGPDIWSIRENAPDSRTRCMGYSKTTVRCISQQHLRAKQRRHI